MIHATHPQAEATQDVGQASNRVGVDDYGVCGCLFHIRVSQSPNVPVTSCVTSPLWLRTAYEL